MASWFIGGFVIVMFMGMVAMGASVGLHSNRITPI